MKTIRKILCFVLEWHWWREKTIFYKETVLDAIKTGTKEICQICGKIKS